MAIITLTTDFGTADTYVGQMKGVILSRCAGASIVDLTHDVPPQDLVAGALHIETAVDAFAPGTVHVAVIDPGVGSDRRAIAIEAEGCFFVGPDNGLFDLALEKRPLRRAVSVENASVLRETVSNTFHGRDVFAPAAAHLAEGHPLEALGPGGECSLMSLDVPRAEMVEGGLVAHVLRVDHFGNLITNVTAAALRDWQTVLDDELVVEAGHVLIEGLSATFADVAIGDPVAYIGSGGRLEIAIRNGNAAEALAAVVGGMIYVRQLR